mmetsp:Transcript_34557/g.72374  ORF Transcript_34557/g.72374 Transcript_34557/m.72374 type:complete len:233 (+) Transcript_34557:637-1335(+)
MEGNNLRIAAGPHGTAVVQEVKVVGVADLKKLHAGLHKTILAGVVHTDGLLARDIATMESLDGSPREDFNRAQKAEFSAPVLEVEAFVLGKLLQVCTESVSEEHTVRINLHGPVVVPPSALGDDHLPCPDKDCSVAPRTPRGHLGDHGADGVALELRVQTSLFVTDKSEVIAREDADAPFALSLHQAHFVPPGHENHEAEERWQGGARDLRGPRWLGRRRDPGHLRSAGSPG